MMALAGVLTKIRHRFGAESAVDDIDRQLLGLLRDDARTSVATLARKLRVERNYIRKVRAWAVDVEGPPARPASWDELEQARRTTAALKFEHPELFATRRTRKPSASAPACLTHAPGCSCDSCVCSRCGKLSPPNPHARALSERCACVRHAENCSCAECHIARAIASGTSLGCGCT